MPFLSPYGLEHRRFELWVEHTVKNIVKLDIWLNLFNFMVSPNHFMKLKPPTSHVCHWVFDCLVFNFFFLMGKFCYDFFCICFKV